MLGTLLFVVFYLNFKMPSLDEHYREIIGFWYRKLKLKLCDSRSIAGDDGGSRRLETLEFKKFASVSLD